MIYPLLTGVSVPKQTNTTTSNKEQMHEGDLLEGTSTNFYTNSCGNFMKVHAKLNKNPQVNLLFHVNSSQNANISKPSNQTRLLKFRKRFCNLYVPNQLWMPKLNDEPRKRKPGVRNLKTDVKSEDILTTKRDFPQSFGSHLNRPVQPEYFFLPMGFSKKSPTPSFCLL